MCHGARQYGRGFRTPHLQLLPPCASGGVDGGASPAAPRGLTLTLPLPLPLTPTLTLTLALAQPNPIQARHLPPLEAYATVREVMERRIFDEQLPCTPDGKASYTPLPTLATPPYLPSYTPLPPYSSYTPLPPWLHPLTSPNLCPAGKPLCGGQDA